MRRYIKYIPSAIIMASAMMFVSCQESLEDRAERESKEYTAKFCPTPVENNVITDSLVFDKKTRTQYYYLTFTGEIDNAELMEEFKSKISVGLLEQTRSNPQTKVYKDAGFSFAYVCRSQSTGKILLNLKYTKKDFDVK